MEVTQSIKNAVEEYHDKYRHPDLREPVFSEIYDLFPDELGTENDNTKWPGPWPQGDKPGVYIIFGNEGQILYIGKAATLASRLSTYFKYTNGRGSSCRIVHSTWKTQPRYLVTISIEHSFEAAGLEEYLIMELSPKENKLWVEK